MDHLFFHGPPAQQRGKEPHFIRGGRVEGPQKRGFVDKTQARLVPGSVQLYSVKEASLESWYLTLQGGAGLPSPFT